MNNTFMWRGLESVALALIFAPEPVTTFVGMGLLGYARKKRAEEQLALRPQARHYFTDFYACKVKMISGSTIAYRASTIRDGQLPLIRSTISRMYQDRSEWENFSKTVTVNARPTTPRPATPQPSGLLETPFLRYQMGLMPKRRQV